MTKLLYEATKGQIQKHFFGLGNKRTFYYIKQALTRSPALGLPNLKKKKKKKSFFLYLDEEQGQL